MGKIFTFSGPRGVGKTTIMDDLRIDYGIMPIVPFTTRAPRPGEIDGRDYNFVSDEEFTTVRNTNGGMFDVLTLPTGSYGTPRKVIEDVLNGPDGSLEHTRTFNLAAASALSLRAEAGDSVQSIFVLPRSWSDIQAQMRLSGVSEEQIIARCSAEPTDLTMLPRFDHLIINAFGEQSAASSNAAAFVLNAAEVQFFESVSADAIPRQR